MAEFHLFDLLVLDLHGQIQDRFDGLPSLSLKIRSVRVLFKHCTSQANVPFLIRLDTLSIEFCRRMIAGSFTKLDELLVLFQCKRLSSELRSPDTLDRKSVV